MLTFAYAWIFLLLPLPLLVRWLAPAYGESRQGLLVPFLTRLGKASGERSSANVAIMRSGGFHTFALLLCWLCALLAAARPQMIEPPITKEIPVRDLLLAIDLSGSMETKDFKNAKGEIVDRLTAVKEVLDDFLSRRKGDRVGLIFFGSAPFVQAPFTEDLNVCRQLLDEAQVRMAGPQTSFGDALGLAINVFDHSEVQERVLIALTDGNDTSSNVPPLKASQIAHDKGIVIHTVAVGDPQAAGEQALDVDTLKGVASSTGGLYSHAADRAQLDVIYHQLDQQETRKAQTISHRPRRDVFWWPLALGFLITFISHTLQLFTHEERRLTRSEPQAVYASYAIFLFTLPGTFHFIRPWWLLALVPTLWLVWALKRHQDAAARWRKIIAPHLLAHLLVGKDQQQQFFTPIRFLTVGLILVIIAIAGPTLRQEPSPFADEISALAVVVKVSPSMETEDLEPNRLTRSVQKIHDLLALRSGAKTSLIAYSGSAHLVMPATKDARVIDTFAQALDPKIMPKEGDVAAAALQLANQSLAEAGSGSIVWITDSVAPEQNAALANWRKQSSTSVYLLAPLPDGAETSNVREAAKRIDARFLQITPDSRDVNQLNRAAKFSTTSSPEMSHHWEESGYWLTPLFIFLLLPFFRRGWMIQTSANA